MLIKFFNIQIQNIHQRTMNCQDSSIRAVKYHHFELKNIIFYENKLPVLTVSLGL